MVIDNTESASLSNDGWSIVDYEEFPWNLNPGAVLSRTQQRRHAGPYRAAMVPAIAGIDGVQLDAATLALVDDASAAVVRFDASGGAELAPFAALLLRSESAASSQIENLTASAKTIALAELGEYAKCNGRIIVANTRAMEAAISLADNLDEQAILATHRALLETSKPEIVGHWRQEQVWIGGTVHGPHRAMFVPPHHTRVSDAMHDLVEFMDRDDLPVLVHTAIAHAQFETIHPFPDGNGRTGRALVHALLRAKGLTRSVTVPISAGLLIDIDSYFAALTAYRQGEYAVIVRLMANAAFRAIENADELLLDLRSIQVGWKDQVTARSDSSVWKIVDLLTRQPVVTSPLIQKELGIAANNALRAIERLEAAGVLAELSGNSRNQRWATIEVLNALDRFAIRAGRRRVV